MNFFNLFKRGGSAPVARDRLQILFAHERSAPNSPDLLTVLREEILTAVAKHVEIKPAAVSVQMNRGNRISTLEVEIEIPNSVRALSSRGRHRRPLQAAHRSA